MEKDIMENMRHNFQKEFSGRYGSKKIERPLTDRPRTFKPPFRSDGEGDEV